MLDVFKKSTEILKTAMAGSVRPGTVVVFNEDAYSVIELTVAEKPGFYRILIEPPSGIPYEGRDVTDLALKLLAQDDVVGLAFESGRLCEVLKQIGYFHYNQSGDSVIYKLDDRIYVVF